MEHVASLVGSTTRARIQFYSPARITPRNKPQAHSRTQAVFWPAGRYKRRLASFGSNQLFHLVKSKQRGPFTNQRVGNGAPKKIFRLNCLICVTKHFQFCYA
jgi:hypothetical protein